MFIRFHMIHERDRQTDTQTDRQTPHADIGRAYASHRAAKSCRSLDFTFQLKYIGEKFLKEQFVRVCATICQLTSFGDNCNMATQRCRL